MSPDPRNGRITELTKELGLLAPFTKQTGDWEKLIQVKELYVTGLDRISKEFLNRPDVDIRRSVEVRARTDLLINDLGPAIWVRLSGKNDKRNWLFKPGNGPLYPRDLFWDEHQDFIRDRFYQLAVEKAVRHRRDHANKLQTKGSERLHSSESDPTRAPNGEQVNNSTRLEARRPIRCFGLEKQSASTPDHLDGTLLQEAGIWLGDCEDHTRVVTGTSYEAEKKRYYKVTHGGRDENDPEKGLTTNKYRAHEPDRQMSCLSCQLGSSEPSQHLKREHIEFNEGDMRRNVWSFPCYIKDGGRKVFALIRSQTKPGGGKQWSFWRIDGGYTDDMFLVKPQTEDVLISEPTYPMSRTRPTRNQESSSAINRYREASSEDNRETSPLSGIEESDTQNNASTTYFENESGELEDMFGTTPSMQAQTTYTSHTTRDSATEGLTPRESQDPLRRSQNVTISEPTSHCDVRAGAKRSRQDDSPELIGPKRIAANEGSANTSALSRNQRSQESIQWPNADLKPGSRTVLPEFAHPRKIHSHEPRSSDLPDYASANLRGTIDRMPTSPAKYLNNNGIGQGDAMRASSSQSIYDQPASTPHNAEGYKAPKESVAVMKPLEGVQRARIFVYWTPDISTVMTLRNCENHRDLFTKLERTRPSEEDRAMKSVTVRFSNAQAAAVPNCRTCRILVEDGEDAFEYLTDVLSDYAPEVRPELEITIEFSG